MVAEGLLGPQKHPTLAGSFSENNQTGWGLAADILAFNIMSLPYLGHMYPSFADLIQSEHMSSSEFECCVTLT